MSQKEEKGVDRREAGATTVGGAVDDGVLLVCEAPHPIKCPTEAMETASETTSEGRTVSTVSVSAAESVTITARDLDVGGA